MTNSGLKEDLDVDTGQQLHDDNGDAIGTPEFCIAEGLHMSGGDSLTQTFAALTAEELAEFLTNRVLIEQAKGMLMFIYSTDAEEAYELLKWRSQANHVKLRRLAEQLVQDLVGMASGQQIDARSACDKLLFTVEERSDLLV